MSDPIVIGAYAGLASGAILTFFSHVAPLFGAGNFILDTDEPRAFGRELTRREAHVLGVFVHLLLSLVFGMGFAYGVERNWIAGFEFFPVLGYAALLFFFVGLVVVPLEGHGVFGVKRDAWFPVDLLLTNVFWGILYVFLSRLWLPV